MKFVLLDQYVQEVCKLFEEYFENKKCNIQNENNKIKSETEKLNKKIEKNTLLKSGNDIFHEWKIKYYIQLKNTSIDAFVNQIKNLIKNVKSVKIDEDIIFDQVTSLWLIRNGLDELIL